MSPQSLQVQRDFKEVLHPNLAIDLQKIKYFSETHFSHTPDIHMLLYSFIECLQVNRMFITSFRFHRKLTMKAK